MEDGDHREEPAFEEWGDLFTLSAAEGPQLFLSLQFPSMTERFG